jgi:NAD-dependent DNA ligase
LSELLVERREKSDFEIDGIVVSHNNSHAHVQGENPKYAFAFKSVQTMDKAEVVVTKIEWNVSKDGYMIPVVHFNPVHLAGVMIQKAHGFNGKYVKDNKLGPGSRIIIMRSGDVIPYIVEVLSASASGTAQMPEIEYEWSKTNVDIIISKKDGATNDIVNLKSIEYFFDKIDIKGISKATISKIYNSGFKDIKSIINVSKTDLLKIDGFKDKTADKIVDGFKQAFSDVDCVLLMDASNTLGRGFGRKKIELILENFPNLLKSRTIPSMNDMVAIKGIEHKTAEAFIDNLPKYFDFYDNLGLKCTEPTQVEKEPNSVKLGHINVVFTGFRDKDIEEYIIANGGKVSGSVSKNTSHVVVKDKNKDSSKAVKAKELGVPVVSVEEFKILIKI